MIAFSRSSSPPPLLLLHRLGQQRDRQQRIMNRVDPKDRRLYENLHHEIETNKGSFRGTIWGPVYREVNVVNELHCKYIERCIPQWVQMVRE